MIRTSEHTASFTTQIDTWIESALRAGAAELTSLLLALPGVYPTDVLESVKRLVARGVVSEDLAANIALSAAPAEPLRDRPSLSTLPVPHPLDFDWRFTREAGREIVNLAQSLGDSLVCIGSPSVFSIAQQRRVFSEATLIDRNRTIIDHFCIMSPSVIQCDVLSDQLPRLNADVIVTDPPWYHEHFRAFLWAAAEICNIGGHVLISLPMQGTRPRVQEDIDDLLEWATTLGFEICDLYEGSLSYETPPFEQNALRALGIALPMDSWRRSTLGVLRKRFVNRVERPTFYSSVKDRWNEASLYGTRFFFRQSVRVGFDDPSLIPMVRGSILPSVSRTHRLRASVDVWTSGNRIFRCQSPQLLKSIAEALSINGDAREVAGFRGTRLEPRLIDQTARKLQDLASMERDERRFIGIG